MFEEKESLYGKFTEPNDERFYYNKDLKCPISDTRNSVKFIEDYFLGGQKKSVFDFDFYNEFIISGKHIHTVSLFYLGILLRKMVEKNLRVKLKNIIKGLNYRFSYSWFLSCLYHDTGTVCETSGLNGRYTDTYNNIIADKDIKYNIFEDLIIDDNGKLELNSIEPTYSLDLVINYCNYIANKRKRQDHGVLGGLLLYDRLVKNHVKNFEEAKAEGIKKGKNVDIKKFTHKKLSWGSSQLSHFAYVSDAIIAHNIWHCSDNPDDVECYKRYDLDRLIPPNAKLNIKDNPLAFFLGLLDTIEPIKSFTNCMPQFVWKNIKMTYDYNVLEIEVLENGLDPTDWFKKIEGAAVWLDVEVDVSGIKDRIIKVKIL